MMLVTVLGEAILIYALARWLGGVAGWIAGVLRLIGILIVLDIVRTSTHLAADLLWIFLIMLFPVFGTAFYLFLGANLLTSKETRQLFFSAVNNAKYYKENADDSGVVDKASKEYPLCSGQIRYLSGHAGFPVYENNENGFDYYPLGDDGFPIILEEMKKAEKFIFLEYFIIARGQMWDQMHEILKDKAADGLDVRVLYDDMGSFSTLPMSYAKTLKEEGIRCIPFNRISPVLGAIMNHRDHRKILVIDGKTAFSGGINLADEYINAIVRFGHWKDNVIRVRGAAVKLHPPTLCSGRIHASFPHRREQHSHLIRRIGHAPLEPDLYEAVGQVHGISAGIGLHRTAIELQLPGFFDDILQKAGQAPPVQDCVNLPLVFKVAEDVAEFLIERNIFRDNGLRPFPIVLHQELPYDVRHIRVIPVEGHAADAGLLTEFAYRDISKFLFLQKCKQCFRQLLPAVEIPLLIAQS